MSCPVSVNHLPNIYRRPGAVGPQGASGAVGPQGAPGDAASDTYSLFLNSGATNVDLSLTLLGSYIILQNGTSDLSLPEARGQYVVPRDGNIESVRIYVGDTGVGNDMVTHVRVNGSNVIDIPVTAGVPSSASYVGPPVPVTSGNLVSFIVDTISDADNTSGPYSVTITFS